MMHGVAQALAGKHKNLHVRFIVAAVKREAHTFDVVNIAAKFTMSSIDMIVLLSYPRTVASSINH